MEPTAGERPGIGECGSLASQPQSINLPLDGVNTLSPPIQGFIRVRVGIDFGRKSSVTTSCSGPLTRSLFQNVRC
jgi:hypothetical protein